MRVGRGTNVGGQTQLCWWADVIMLRNHYLTWFHIDQKFALFSHEGRSKDRFFKNTSHHNRRQTKTGLNAATHDLITNFFLEKFKKKMVDRHGGLKREPQNWWITSYFGPTEPKINHTVQFVSMRYSRTPLMVRHTTIAQEFCQTLSVTSLECSWIPYPSFGCSCTNPM